MSDLSGLDAIRDIPNPISADERRAASLRERKSNYIRREFLISDIRASTSGELFLYVNDAMLLWPGYVNIFYRMTPA